MSVEQEGVWRVMWRTTWLVHSAAQVASQQGAYVAHVLNRRYKVGMGGMSEDPPTKPARSMQWIDRVTGSVDLDEQEQVRGWGGWGCGRAQVHALGCVYRDVWKRCQGLRAGCVCLWERAFMCVPRGLSSRRATLNPEKLPPNHESCQMGMASKVLQRTSSSHCCCCCSYCCYCCCSPW